MFKSSAPSKQTEPMHGFTPSPMNAREAEEKKKTNDTRDRADHLPFFPSSHLLQMQNNRGTLSSFFFSLWHHRQSCRSVYFIRRPFCFLHSNRTQYLRAQVQARPLPRMNRDFGFWHTPKMHGCALLPAAAAARNLSTTRCPL